MIFRETLNIVIPLEFTDEWHDADEYLIQNGYVKDMAELEAIRGYKGASLFEQVPRDEEMESKQIRVSDATYSYYNKKVGSLISDILGNEKPLLDAMSDCCPVSFFNAMEFEWDANEDSGWGSYLKVRCDAVSDEEDAPPREEDFFGEGADKIITQALFDITHLKGVRVKDIQKHWKYCQGEINWRW